MVLLTSPTVIVLSMCIGVGGCGCPSLPRVKQRTLASWALRKRAPNSASAGGCSNEFEDGTSDVNSSVQFDWIAVSWYAAKEEISIGSLLQARGADRYDALECTLSIMSDVRYRILASGCVHM
jgi:hypothetical protein